MKRGIVALTSLIAGWVGIEGLCFLGGTVGLAAVADHYIAFGALAVVSIAGLLLGVALTLPRRD